MFRKSKYCSSLLVCGILPIAQEKNYYKIEKSLSAFHKVRKIPAAISRSFYRFDFF
jgi:hypothetical protein